MFPCKDCIVLVMCKEKIVNYIKDSVYTQSRERHNDYIIYQLSTTCSILYNYLKVKDKYGFNINRDRILLVDRLIVRKALIGKLNESINFFNLPKRIANVEPTKE